MTHGKLNTKGKKWKIVEVMKWEFFLINRCLRVDEILNMVYSRHRLPPITWSVPAFFGRGYAQLYVADVLKIVIPNRFSGKLFL